MNGQADGEIRVDTRIDPDGFERDSKKFADAVKGLEAQARQLGQELKAAVKSGSFTSFNEQAERARSEAERLKADLQNLADVPVKTDLYVEYEGMIEKARQALDRLIERQDKLRETGVKENSQQWRNLQYDIDKAREKVSELHNEMTLMENEGYAFMAGSDTEQFAALQQQLEAAERRIEATERAADEERRLAEEAERAAAAAAEAAENERQLKEQARQAKEQTRALARANEEYKRGFDGLIGKAKRFVFTMMGMRGLYGLLRKAVSSYLENHEDATARLEASIARLGEALGPLIEFVINGLTVIVDLVTRILEMIGLVSSSAGTAASEAGKAAEEGGKKAERAWKRARDVMGFDELNRMGDHTEQQTETSTSTPGTGMEGGLGAALQVDDDTLRRLAEVLATLEGVKLALTALKSGKPILQGLAGALLAVIGGITEFLGLKDILTDGIDWGNFLESVIGGGVLIAGAAMIGKAFGNTFLGAAIGAIIAGVPMFVVGIIDSIKEGISLKSAALTAIGSTIAGAGIGFLFGGPTGALIGAAIGLAVGLISDFTIWVTQNWDSIKEKAAQTWEKIRQKTGEVWTGIRDKAKETWTNIKESVLQKAEDIRAKTAETWSAVKEKASTLWTDTKEKISSTVSNIKNAVAQKWSDIRGNTAAKFLEIKENAAREWTNIKNQITGKAAESGNNVAKHFTDLKSKLSSLHDQMKADAVKSWNAIKDSASNKWSEIKDTVRSKWQETKAEISNTVSSWIQIGKDLIDGVKQGIREAWSNLTTTVVELFWNLVDNIKSVFGIHSPSTVMAGIFENVDKGAEVGLENGRRSLLNAAGELADDVLDAMSPEAPGFDVSGLRRNAAAAAAAVASETAKSLDRGDFLAEIGVNGELDSALDAFSDKISSRFAALMDKLQAIADGMRWPTLAGGFVPYAVTAGAPPMGAGNEELKNYLAEYFADIIGALVSGFELMESETQGLREDVQAIQIGDTTIGEANDRYNDRKAVMRGRR